MRCAADHLRHVLAIGVLDLPPLRVQVRSETTTPNPSTQETKIWCPRCNCDIALVDIITPDVYASFCIPEPACEDCGIFTIRKLMPFRLVNHRGKHEGGWHCGRCDKRFEWVNPNKHQEASLAVMCQRIEKELGIVCMRHTLFVARHGLTKAVQTSSAGAIAKCTIFVAILNDDYLRTPSSCKEFLCAVHSRRQILPIIVDPWTVPNVGGKWYPADSVVRMDDGIPVAMPWSILRSFPPVDMRNVPRDVSKSAVEHDKVLQLLSSCIMRVDPADGESEAARIYTEINKVRSAMLATLGDVGMMSQQDLDKECRKMFQKLDGMSNPQQSKLNSAVRLSGWPRLRPADQRQHVALHA